MSEGQKTIVGLFCSLFYYACIVMAVMGAAAFVQWEDSPSQWSADARFFAAIGAAFSAGLGAIPNLGSNGLTSKLRDAICEMIEEQPK